MVIKRILTSEKYERTLALALIVLGVWFLCVNLNFWVGRRPIVDDAFIEFRNSFNLAHGYGLAWNPGETPAESSSNILAVLIFAPFILLQFDPVIVSHVIGVLALLATGFLLFRVCLKCGVNRLVALLAACIYVCVPALAYLALSGFQTTLFSFTLFLFFFSGLSSQEHRSKANLALAFSFLLLILTRPEGIFFGFSGLAFLWLLNGKKDSYRKQKFLLPALSSVALGIVYLLWKYFYFGSIFSLPIMVKTSNPFDFPGKCELALFILRYPVFCIFGFIGAVKSYRKQPVVRHCVFFILLILSLYLLNCHLSGNESRFFIPALPFLLVLTALALDSLLKAFPKGIYKSSFLIMAMVLFNPSIIHPPGSSFVQIRKLFFCRGNKLPKSAADVNIMIAKQLAKIKNHSQLVVVAEDPGALGYYSGTKVIDPVGLANIRFARCKTKEEFIRTVFSYNPDLILFRTAISPEGYDEMERNRCGNCTWGALGRFGRASIIESENFKNRYISIGKILEADKSRSSFFWNFWVRIDSPYYREIHLALLELMQ